MFENANIFIERQRYSNNDYKNTLASSDVVQEFIKTDGNTFEFVVTGFLIVNDMPIVIFPKNYKVSKVDSEIKSDVMLLLRVIMKYRLEKFHEPEEIKLLYGDEKYSTGKIVSAISIIEDYLLNGYVKRKFVDTSSSHRGFTDWHKTVNQNLPTISHGRPLYLSQIRRSQVIDTENALTKIHVWVTNECFKMWGWLYGFDDILQEENSPYPLEEMLDMLKTEESKTYVEREIYLIRNLILYLKSFKGYEKQITYDLMVTPYFNLIWESICGFVYSNEYNKLFKWVAQPIWDGPHISKNISQRPDILFVDKETFYILDAKYYDYNNTIPGWHDVVKQLFYKYTIEKKIQNRGDKLIKYYENVLIFPENSANNFTYLGKVYVDGVADLGEVKAFAINTKKAMEAYSTGDKSTFKKELLINIEKINLIPDATTKRLLAYEKVMRG